MKNNNSMEELKNMQLSDYEILEGKVITLEQKLVKQEVRIDFWRNIFIGVFVLFSLFYYFA